MVRDGSRKEVTACEVVGRRLAKTVQPIGKGRQERPISDYFPRQS